MTIAKARLAAAYRAARAARQRDEGFVGALMFAVIIALLIGGYLIASGGDFNPSTNREKDRLNAGSVQNQAQQMANGVMRTLGGGYDVANIEVSQSDPAVTGSGDTVELFSPDGGGLTMPVAPTGARASTSNLWILTKAATVPGFTGAQFAAVLVVRQAVCAQINQALYGSNAIPAATGTMSTIATTGAFDATGATAGRSEQCVSGGGAHYYYKILAPQ